MKLPKKMQWLKEHLEAQMTDHKNSLWDDYESNKMDAFIVEGEPEDTFELGWDLGRIEAIQEILDFIEGSDIPVYGDQ